MSTPKTPTPGKIAHNNEKNTESTKRNLDYSTYMGLASTYDDITTTPVSSKRPRITEAELPGSRTPTTPQTPLTPAGENSSEDHDVYKFSVHDLY